MNACMRGIKLCQLEPAPASHSWDLLWRGTSLIVTVIYCLCPRYSKHFRSGILPSSSSIDFPANHRPNRCDPGHPQANYDQSCPSSVVGKNHQQIWEPQL